MFQRSALALGAIHTRASCKLLPRRWKYEPSRSRQRRIHSARPEPPPRRDNFLTTPAGPTQNQQQQHRRRRQLPGYIWISAGGTLFLIGSSYIAFLDRVPLTNRQRWIATDMAMEQELGDVEYQQLLQQFRGAILPPNHRATKTVQRVGNRIMAAAQEFMEKHHASTNMPSRSLTLFSRPYTFTVVQSDMANAFCLPGNHVFIMTGLFKYARTEDELAAVMGHEGTCTFDRRNLFARTSDHLRDASD